MPVIKQSPFRCHVTKWQNCTKCSLCQNRTNTVFTRGTVPCDVLFIGEGPGASEDILGKPFIGPAGKLLDDLIFDATGILPQCQKTATVKIAFTNLVSCLPDTIDGKLDKPSDLQIEACAPRLKEFVKICHPSIVICVGKLATDRVSRDSENCQFFDILHPSVILQMDISRKGLAIKRTVEVIKKAFDSLTPF